ncbi:MAG: DEAD/DEAH box helicase [Thermodesulfovibrionales bacterium]|nr:DEAD/DEAH box helicase [Thermodesulfovibrionales bacterium]
MSSLSLAFQKEFTDILKVLTNYEIRPDQIEMALAINKALIEKKHLIVEAGTGVGKSLAYLIPLIKWVQEGDEEYRKAVVSTYTKALQRQLIEKELPFLKENIFHDLNYTLSLGSENYLCLRRLDKTLSTGLFDEPDWQIRNLLSWSKRTTSGVKYELEISNYTWLKVCRDSDACFGKKCKFYNKCFYQKAKSKERQSHIIVINHHLFFANVVSNWNVLPLFHSSVLDEAHELEDVAAIYLSTEFSKSSFKYHLDSIKNISERGFLAQPKWLNNKVKEKIIRVVNILNTSVDIFFLAVSNFLGNSSTKRIYTDNNFKDNISEVLVELSFNLKKLKEDCQDEEDEDLVEIIALLQKTDGFISSLGLLLQKRLENHVYWAEKEAKSIRLVATPIDIALLIKKNVFDILRPSILCSATLSTNGNFDFIKERLGIQEADSLLLKSPFNYKDQVLIYIPDDMPEPNEEFFDEEVIKKVKDIVEITKGRTLVLFTNYRLLNKTYERLSQDTNLIFLKQGEADSYTLIEEFKKIDNSVLLGTYTFWQGIDLPGDELQCVVITKLPFAVPDEPLVQARMELLINSGKNPFYHYQIPTAAILLKQGFGRLVRSKSDKGVVAILDSRIIIKGYGKEFIKSLPECRVTNSLVEFKNFMETLKG